MILNNNKLVVSVMTKLAPQLSPLCPPNDLFIKFGIKMEVIKPVEMQYINNKVLYIFKLFRNRKRIMPPESIIKDGLISLDRPFQFL